MGPSILEFPLSAPLLQGKMATLAHPIALQHLRLLLYRCRIASNHLPALAFRSALSSVPCLSRANTSPPFLVAASVAGSHLLLTTIVICEVYTKRGRRAFPAMMVGSAAVFIDCDESWNLLLVTKRGVLYVWDLFRRTCLLHDSLSSLIVPREDLPAKDAGKIKVISAKFSSSGSPLVVLATRHAFLFDMNLRCWLRIADDCFPASNFSSSLNLNSVRGGELASLQVDIGKFIARNPSWSRVTDDGAQTRAHLETQLASSLALKSSNEYRQCLLSYVRFLASREADESRLREVCDSFLGPPTGMAESAADVNNPAWDPVVLERSLLFSSYTGFQETRSVPDVRHLPILIGRHEMLADCLLLQLDEFDLTLVEWWDTYGSLTPALKRVAKRILGLCCTSSSCERNWSAFDFGIKKHKLLKEDILPAMVSNRKVQRLLNEFVDILSEYENGESNADHVDPSPAVENHASIKPSPAVEDPASLKPCPNSRGTS